MKIKDPSVLDEPNMDLIVDYFDLECNFKNRKKENYHYIIKNNNEAMYHIIKNAIRIIKIINTNSKEKYNCKIKLKDKHIPIGNGNKISFSNVFKNNRIDDGLFDIIKDYIDNFDKIILVYHYEFDYGGYITPIKLNIYCNEEVFNELKFLLDIYFI